MTTVKYDKKYSYSRIVPAPFGRKRPMIPIRITYMGKSIDRLAIVDSGADLSIFPKTAATSLGINLSKITTEQSDGTAGPVDTWYCVCELSVEGITKYCEVGFVDNEDSPYLFGREPFFSLLQIGFRESLKEFYFALSP